jgi:hypothetical protein
MGKLNKLLDGSLESYYWLGFLCADGHFSKTNRLNVTLSAKDKMHLINLAKFLELPVEIVQDIKNKNNYALSRIVIMDTETISKLKTTYKISSNKTENPVNIKSLNYEQLISFKIGFIDGDGSIQFQTRRKDVKISVKLHANWLPILLELFGKGYINNAGYAFCTEADSEKIKELKNFAIDKNLPVLSRKWNKIDLNYTSRYVSAKQWRMLAINLKKQGLSYVDIALMLNKKYTTVYNAIKRNEYELLERK